ncbi:MAG TPA: extracellular solute-binding protein [Chloroflexota bacterium]|nr:extracellular solute-binding protein [Chloroflexota bacterium]
MIGQPSRRAALRFLARTALATGALSILAACGASGTASTAGTAVTTAPPAGASGTTSATGTATTSAASSTASAAPVAHTPVAGKINLVAYMRTSEQEAFTKRSDQFNQANPSIHVDFESLTGDYYTPLKTRIAAGQPPDVYYAHTSNMAYQNFATGGTALQIDDLIAKNKVDLGQWFPQGIAALKLSGKLYGLPVRGQVAWLFMYYNADLIKKHGIDPPTANWTLDDLVNAGKQLTTTNGGNVDVWGLGPSNFGYEGTCGHVRRWNGEYWNPASGPGTTCTLDSDACVASMAWSWNLMYKDKIMAPTSVTPEKLFGQSKLAISIERLAGERATYAQNTNKQFSWGLQVMPKGPTGRRGGFLSTDSLQISKATKSPDVAFQLLQWYTNKDSGIAAALQSKGSLTPGFRPDVYCSPELLSDARFPKEAMQINCDNASVNESYTYPANFRISEINTIMAQYEKELWSGKQEPTSSYMKQYADAINATTKLPVQ